MQRPVPIRSHGRRRGLYDSGWTILLLLVGAPLGFFVVVYYGVHLVFWALARGSAYRAEDDPFIGVVPMVGLNLLAPGTGLMAGGFSLQGWACLILWILVFSTALQYAALPTRNLTIVHLFAGLWASVQGGLEAWTLSRQAPRGEPTPTRRKVDVHKVRVPTLEDPDLYPIRLEAFQLLLEAAPDEEGNLDSIQQAAVNRLRHLLRIEDRTYARLSRQVTEQTRARGNPGLGARLGRTRSFERVLELAADHPAFDDCRDGFLDAAANLLAIPAREARARLEAYERGESYDPDESLVDSRMPDESEGGAA